MKKVAVIGGGASGLVAALFASKGGNRVTLYEKQNKIGRKILATGNGRCNLSNRTIDLSHYHGNNPKFVLDVFSKFGLSETIKLFESIGIPLVEGKGGRLFPASLQAVTITKVLAYELSKRGVELKINRKIERVTPQKDGIQVITAGREGAVFDSCILSTGNCAQPQLRGSRIGLEIASSLGHKIFTPFPAISPINIPLKIIHRLEGLKWNSRVMVEIDGNIVKDSTDELLFTKYGISGPASLNISRTVNKNILNGKSPCIVIDFFPDLSEGELLEELENLWYDTDKEVCFSLIGIMKDRMSEILLKIASIDLKKTVKHLKENEKRIITKTLKSLRLIPGKSRAFNDAIVAAGGVDVDEIDSSTMESKIIKNLYITGELLDIDGDSGGYNLQFAWSTGALAGISQ